MRGRGGHELQGGGVGYGDGAVIHYNGGGTKGQTLKGEGGKGIVLQFEKN